MMTDEITEIISIDELRNFVNKTLCEHEQLELGAFRLHERILVRSGRPCGMHFTICGPRAVTFSAIWETERHTVLFYGCNGERFHRTQLSVTHQLVNEFATIQ